MLAFYICYSFVRVTHWNWNLWHLFLIFLVSKICTKMRKPQKNLKNYQKPETPKPQQKKIKCLEGLVRPRCRDRSDLSFNMRWTHDKNNGELSMKLNDFGGRASSRRVDRRFPHFPVVSIIFRFVRWWFVASPTRLTNINDLSSAVLSTRKYRIGNPTSRPHHPLPTDIPSMVFFTIILVAQRT